MTVKKIVAPDITPRYPSKGSRIGPAWADIWRELAAAGDAWTDGQAVSVRVAGNHDLAPATVRNLLTSAAKAGLLEHTYRNVDTESGTAGTRLRTFYRIKG
jgi:hypothetical protein